MGHSAQHCPLCQSHHQRTVTIRTEHADLADKDVFAPACRNDFARSQRLLWHGRAPNASTRCAARTTDLPDEGVQTNFGAAMRARTRTGEPRPVRWTDDGRRPRQTTSTALALDRPRSGGLRLAFFQRHEPDTYAFRRTRREAWQRRYAADVRPTATDPREADASRTMAALRQQTREPSRELAADDFERQWLRQHRAARQRGNLPP